MHAYYSTRSPRAVPYDLLESSSLTILHAFNSQDWLMCVQHALALDSATAQELPYLDNGQALLCCPKVSFNTCYSAIKTDCEYTAVTKLQILELHTV
jgi:hypothetical protein